jgi:hypothetical protein
LPILLKERVAAAHRGQRFQVQKWVQDLMNPDIVGHFVDPAGRRQEGSAGECRSEGRNRDFLALGRWGRGGTAGTSGSAVGLGCHFAVAGLRTLSLAPYSTAPQTARKYGRRKENGRKATPHSTFNNHTCIPLISTRAIKVSCPTLMQATPQCQPRRTQT